MNRQEMLVAINDAIDYLESLRNSKYNSDALYVANDLRDVADELERRDEPQLTESQRILQS